MMKMLGTVGDVILLYVHDNVTYESITVSLIDYTEEEMGILDSVERELDTFGKDK